MGNLPGLNVITHPNNDVACFDIIRNDGVVHKHQATHNHKSEATWKCDCGKETLSAVLSSVTRFEAVDDEDDERVVRDYLFNKEGPMVKNMSWLSSDRRVESNIRKQWSGISGDVLTEILNKEEE